LEKLVPVILSILASAHEIKVSTSEAVGSVALVKLVLRREPTFAFVVYAVKL
jgi:hypothetical protein